MAVVPTASLGRRNRQLRAFLKHERMTVAMNSASVSHRSSKKTDVIHTAVQNEEYVDPPAPVDVNVAPPPAETCAATAPENDIADHLEPPGATHPTH